MVALGFVVVDCPTVLPGVVPAVVPALAPVCVLCEPTVVELLLVVPGAVLVLVPPIPVPVDPAVCAPAQANAPSSTGAANHVRFIAWSLCELLVSYFCLIACATRLFDSSAKKDGCS